MGQTPKIIAAAAASAAVALPAGAAFAATPRTGAWLNSSQTNGAEFTTGGRTIKNLGIFCKHTRYDLNDFVHVRRNGSFRYSGIARRWGYEHQPWGRGRVRFSGRFTSATRVTLSGSFARCGRLTVNVSR